MPIKREQRQVHGDDHAADHQAQENDHDRFEGGQQVFDGDVHFVFVKVRDLLQHGVHRAGLFADCDHLRNHAGKHFGFLQGFGQRFTFFQGFADLVEGSLDDRVAGGLGSNVQAFEDRHAARD